MSQEKNYKKLIWILILIILLIFLFIIYNKFLSVDTKVTPLEPEVDTESIQELEELEEKVEEAKDEDEDDDEDEEVKELEEKVEDLEEKVEDLEDEAKEEEKKEELEEKVEDLEEKVEDLEEEKEEAKEEEKEEAVAYEGENFINLISPNDGAGFSTEPIEFTGKVSPNTEKIVVKATGGDPNCNENTDGACAKYINDTYTLASFELGDDSFIYRAKYEWDNLTGGMNNYKFTAHFDDGSSKSTELSIESYVNAGAIPSMITINSPVDGKKFNLNELPIEFTGSVSKNTTKIVVTATAENPTCISLLKTDKDVVCTPYMNDVYTLKDFKHGDDSFIYRAKIEWGNLIESPKENHYIFTAHFDDGSTESVSIGVNFFPYF